MPAHRQFARRIRSAPGEVAQYRMSATRLRNQQVVGRHAKTSGRISYSRCRCTADHAAQVPSRLVESEYLEAKAAVRPAGQISWLRPPDVLKVERHLRRLLIGRSAVRFTVNGIAAFVPLNKCPSSPTGRYDSR